MEKQKTSTKYLGADYERVNLKIKNLFWYIVERLSGTSNFIKELYEKSVGIEYRKEIAKFNLSKSKKILHIGCGPYPITAFILAEMNSAKIVAIDHNKKCIKIARKVIEQKKMNGKIYAEYGEGLNYPLEGFDTIITSGGVQPNIQVINHILKNSDEKSKIIIREAYYKEEVIKDIIKNDINIELITKINNHAFRTSDWKSYYIIKK